MLISFLTSAHDPEPAHVAEIDSPEALRNWLVQDHSGMHWLIAVDHGAAQPVLVIGARAGFVTVRGGWDFPLADAVTLWGYITRAASSEAAVDAFLDGARDFTRRAVFPTPRLVK